jgi:hypothetical protein
MLAPSQHDQIPIRCWLMRCLPICIGRTVVDNRVKNCRLNSTLPLRTQ